MSGYSTRISVPGGEILLVPAVHFRAAFAERVHRLVADPAAGIGAIAVELGPGLVEVAVRWLGELASRPDLPLLLGLLSHASPAEPDLPGPAARLLPLSPSDSIVEAMRCGVEVGLPVFGADLEFFPANDPLDPRIEDPAVLDMDLDAYVSRNAAYAEQVRTEPTDHARELHMAGRLKALVVRYRRVLFTCGLAHFGPLCRLLPDPTVHPIPSAPSDRPHAERILIHPSLAFSYLDVLPAVAEEWNRRRERPRGERPTPPGTIRPAAILSRALDATMEDRLRAAEEDPRRGLDLRFAPSFERLLASVGLLERRSVPSAGRCLEIADSMLSAGYCRALGRHLLDVDWADPEDWPGLALLSPRRALRDEGAAAGAAQLDTRRPADGSTLPGRKIVHFRTAMGGSGGAALPDPWALRHLEAAKAPVKLGPDLLREPHPRIWPPCSFLLSHFRLRASEVARRPGDDIRVDPFEGSLGDGVDVKATLRARARAENRILIRNCRPKAASRRLDDIAYEPTVILFRPAAHPSASWYPFAGPMDIIHRPHIQDRARFETILEEFGNQLVQALGYCVRRPAPGHLADVIQGAISIQGIVCFTYCHLNALVEARWLERTDYRGSPIHAGSDISSFIEMYRERHGLTLDPAHWVEMLALSALPYAKSRVVIVAPDDLVITRRTETEALRRGLMLDFAPLSAFSGELVERARRPFVVRPEDMDGTRYDEEIERRLGESMWQNRELVPTRLYQ